MERGNVPLLNTSGHRQEDTDSSGETAVGGPAEVLFSRVEMVKDKCLPLLTPPSEEQAVLPRHILLASSCWTRIGRPGFISDDRGAESGMAA